MVRPIVRSVADAKIGRAIRRMDATINCTIRHRTSRFIYDLSWEAMIDRMIGR